MSAEVVSNLGDIYRRTYKALCGEHPHERPWHFQWLAILYLRRRLLRLLPAYGGRVVDVGCGNKPYRAWFGDTSEYLGLDVAAGAQVDIVVSPDAQWPLPDQNYDVLLSTQVIEHVVSLEFTLNQMSRVLKAGGVMILSFPFLYNVHGAPHDYRRFTLYGAERLLPGYEIVHLECLGGIGSTLVILLLNWIDTALSGFFVTRLLKAPFLPLFIALSFVLNLLGFLMDRLDRTQAFYSNVLLVARKRSE